MKTTTTTTAQPSGNIHSTGSLRLRTGRLDGAFGTLCFGIHACFVFVNRNGFLGMSIEKLDRDTHTLFNSIKTGIRMYYTYENTCVSTLAKNPNTFF
jgi:hypothetical protein